MFKPVLIVEDNRLNMKLFDCLLQTHDYDTIQSMDGQDAVALNEQAKPDLILMDI